MWAYNATVKGTIAEFEHALGMHTYPLSNAPERSRTSFVASYLRSDSLVSSLPSPLSPQDDSQVRWPKEPSVGDVGSGASSETQVATPSSQGANSPDQQAAVTSQLVETPPAEARTALPQASRDEHTRAASGAAQLPNYWVSGVDGSFPELPADQLSEYHSVGKTESFIGDIMVPGNAAEAYRKCSYKQEAIVMCTDVGDIWFEFAFGQVMMMRERGYAHVIVYMDSHENCKKFQQYMPDVCCVFSSIFEQDKQLSDFWTPLGRLWTIRWLLVGKGLQLGYNVLHVDNDVMFTTDIYRYLKHPIFSEYNIIALGSPDLIGINCGIVYGQNAHPAGPSAWAAYQVPDRTMRWLDDQAYILDKLNATGRQTKLQDIGFEQSVYNDALWSIVSGKPVFAHSMRPEHEPALMGKWLKYHKEMGPETMKRRKLEGPEEWAPILQRRFNNTDATVSLRYYDTQLVSRGEQHDERLGPWPFPDQRGPLSQEVMRFIADGADTIFPDWERPVSDELVDATREKFLLAPGWLMGAWNKDGWHGYWHIDRPHAVMAHMVGIGGKHQQGKKLGFKVGGWWHYNATAMLQGERIFWSSTQKRPLPRMLVVQPGVLLKAAKLDELMGMHIGLIIAGYLSDRVWHWPLLDCHGHWARVSSDETHWTGSFDPRVLPYGGPGNLKCIALDLTWNYCMEKGMSGPDFQHYARLRPDLVAMTPENTVHLPDEYVSNPWDNAAPKIKSVTDVQLHSLLDAVKDQHVVYLSDLFLLRQSGRSGAVDGTCVPNCDYDAMKPGLMAELQKFESVHGCHPFETHILPRH